MKSSTKNLGRAGSFLKKIKHFFNFSGSASHNFLPSVIREARIADLERLAYIEEQCWPGSRRTSKNIIKSRIENYPEGQFVMEKEGIIVGVVYSQRIEGKDQFYKMKTDTAWEFHTPAGNIAQLLGVSVLPTYQGHGFGDELLDYLINFYKSKKEILNFFGVSFCKNYRQQNELSLNEYVHLRDKNGFIKDPILRFHERHGARVGGLLKGYRPDDYQNDGCGVLMDYKNIFDNYTEEKIFKKENEKDKQEESAFLENLVRGYLGSSGEYHYSENTPLMEMGLDSADLLNLRDQLNSYYGTKLEASFFFEHKKVSDIKKYFKNHQFESQGKNKTEEQIKKVDSITKPSNNDDDIAIIGMACRLPGEINDLDSLWEFLKEGKNAIDIIPKDRWDWPSEFNSENHPGIDKGVFLKDIANFDAELFRISPKEAENMDPQQRFMLELVWEVIEKSGYYSSNLASTGVFIGASGSDYQRLLDQNHIPVEAHSGLGTSMAILANRISYFYNFKGQSLLIDTACSSSLVALYEAVESLKQRKCKTAIVGGIHLMCHPGNTIAYYNAGMLSKEGMCRPFDEKANGYVRSEGAVVLLLKPFKAAVEDGDQIHAVIKGVACNHGGEANGLTVPNPNQQAALLREACKEAKVNPAEIGYVEAHGTGTSLGDPIEIKGIKEVYGQLKDHNVLPCGIGSIKSNIGHLEAAAGLAGLLKVVLVLKNKEIPKTVHFEKLNPHINLEGTSLYVVDHNQVWKNEKNRTRIAAISSFGSGGTNAHAIVEEYVQQDDCCNRENTRSNDEDPVCIVLSAKNSERLKEYAQKLKSFLEDHRNINLRDIAYTLQVSRATMEERLGILADSIEEVVEKLNDYISGVEDKNSFYIGNTKNKNKVISSKDEEEFYQKLPRLIKEKEHSEILTAWVKGLSVNWDRLYEANKPKRVPLPTYPFARERYWIEGRTERAACGKQRMLHPLVHENTSILSKQRFSTTFTGDEFFLRDHIINGKKVLPGVVYLEMARQAVRLSIGHENKQIDLHNVVWIKPIIVQDKPSVVNISLVPEKNGEILYEIYTNDSDEITVNSQGRAILKNRKTKGEFPKYDLEITKSLGDTDELSGEECYRGFKKMGFNYGSTHQSIEKIYIKNEGDDSLILGILKLPNSISATEQEYELHPSIMDGALQACLGIIKDEWPNLNNPYLPFALDSLQFFSPCRSKMWVLIKKSTEKGSETIKKFNISLCDDYGNVCIAISGYVIRELKENNTYSLWMMTHQWKDKEIEKGIRLEEVKTHIIRYDTGTMGFEEKALDLFDRIKGVIESKPQENHLFQIITKDPLDFGLAGALKTAHLENPKVYGQIICLSKTEKQIEEILKENQHHLGDVEIWYEEDRRKVKELEEIKESSEEKGSPYKDNGLYLITGGAGGLGFIFAKDILEKTNSSTIILTGRSELDEKRVEKFEKLQLLAQKTNSKIEYIKADIANQSDVQNLIGQIKSSYGKLNGIIHSAGILKGNFILKKDREEFKTVLTPKVRGTINLDEATKDIELDFFVFFSSISGAFGNEGVIDYAAGNAFMDAFAKGRNTQVTIGKRFGHTLSINWPLWNDGGMRINEAFVKAMENRMGFIPIATDSGLELFYLSFLTKKDQVVVGAGIKQKLYDYLNKVKEGLPIQDKPDFLYEEKGKQISENPSSDEILFQKTIQFFKKQISEVIKLPISKLDDKEQLGKYGIDSIIIIKLTNELEKIFGLLPKTLFFEYQNISDLSHYFLKVHSSKLLEIFKIERPAEKNLPINTIDNNLSRKEITKTEKEAFVQQKENQETNKNDIAIIGLSGRYPESPDVKAFWNNLKDGKDCITEIPPARWDWKKYYDQNEIVALYSKWGGFIEGVDKFDPLFFNISPREAVIIDPQERLFLEHVWTALEDAGIVRSELKVANDGDLPGQVGVYAGVMWNEYQMLGAEAMLQGKRIASMGTFASIANRISYVLNLHGPSMTVDTMCSSSLTSIHLACEDLKHYRTDIGIAGGVNLSIHPNKYLALSSVHFLSKDGRCQSFGEGGEGYVPGEGVGVVILKRLADAIVSGDRIYGVIKGTSINHGGRTNGFYVPNPNAQQMLVERAFRDAQVNPRTISYVEAHGTGTKLGDPIEIAGLTRAFQSATNDKEYCSIGSVKSNIGHCEAAAGISGLTKVLLQLEHKKIAPSLHAEALNPNIDFKETPFVVNRELREWKRPIVDGKEYPRRAAISSFGAGGSNAHIIIEEYAEEKPVPVLALDESNPVLIVLSAKNNERLKEYAKNLKSFLEEEIKKSAEEVPDLKDIAYTLQIGREVMEERLGIMSTSFNDLVDKLNKYLLEEEEVEGVYIGNNSQNKENLKSFYKDAEFLELIDKWIKNKKYSKVLELWAKGFNIDWNQLYGGIRHNKISLPTYPFAKERYWIDIPLTKVEPLVPVFLNHRQFPIELSKLDGTDESSTHSIEEIAKKSEDNITQPISIYDHGEGVLGIKAGIIKNQDQLNHFLDDLEKQIHAFQNERKFKIIALIFDDVLEVSLKQNREQYISTIFELPIIVVIKNEKEKTFIKKLENQFDFIFTGHNAEEKAIEQAFEIARAPRHSLVQLKAHLAQEFLKKNYYDEKFWFQQGASPQNLDVEYARPIGLKSSVIKAESYNNGIVLATMCDEQSKNGFSKALSEGMEELFSYIENDLDCKVVVLTGYGNYFSSGGTKEGLLAIQEGKEQFNDAPIYQLPLKCSIPVIAAMQGHGIGAGWALGMYSDIVFLSEESTYCCPYMSYGFTPGAGSTLIFPMRFGAQLGKEILFSAKDYQGMELKKRNNSLAVVPKKFVISEALKIASQLACLTREELKKLKLQKSHAFLEILSKVISQEIKMHEATFVGNPEVRQRIEKKFNVSVEDQSSLLEEHFESQQISNEEAVLIKNSLKELLSTELHIKAKDIDENIKFIDMGLDSVSGVRWVRSVNEKYGLSIEATKIYAYPTLREFCFYILKDIPTGRTSKKIETTIIETNQVGLDQPKKIVPTLLTKFETSNRYQEQQTVTDRQSSNKKEILQKKRSNCIAIVGMSGRFPMAETLEDFWNNLKTGKDCVSVIPKDRWSIDEYYTSNPAAPGKTYSKWMGALENVDKFDPLFFNISPKAAEIIDPQQRIFLEECWSCIEDAGYNADSLSGSQWGVFAGCGSTDYLESLSKDQLNAQRFMGSSNSILASRISYFLNIQGPSIAVDTACSSSLVAISMACDNLVAKNCDAALAGGVCVMAGPNMHIMTSKAGMLSPDGRCKPFDQDANGLVPGEGVGVILLKRLEDAIHDKDHIYGVIRGWGVNQDGKTNGITAPNPEAQTKLERSIYNRFDINPNDISLVETHGTGTKLGDPIEVEALIEAFRYYTDREEYCALESVKSNVGHLLMAAGVASVIKVLLSIKNKKLPGTIHYHSPNEHISLVKSPFYVNAQLKEWPLEDKKVRCAAVSSFGFSGTNAHIVIEEYLPDDESKAIESRSFAIDALDPIVIVLSAKNKERLKEYAKKLMNLISKSKDDQNSIPLNLRNISYTLQVGRRPMEERLGIIISSLEELEKKLKQFLNGVENTENIYVGRIDASNENKINDSVHQQSINHFLQEKKYAELLVSWVKGSEIHWEKLYGDEKPARISLPTYPFAKERYWLDESQEASASNEEWKREVLHPLLHRKH